MQIQQKSSKGNPCVGNRHPTETKCRISTVRPSPISCGKRDRALLLYLNESPTDRFNVRAYSRLTGIKRTTVYDMLARLTDNGFVERICYGCHNITQLGISLLDCTKSVGNPSRRECRESGTLSTHFSKYKAIIGDRKRFSESFIQNLDPISWKMTELPNLIQYHISFHDATITINPKKIIINIHDIINEDVDDAHIELFKKAVHYVEKLGKIGLVTEGLILDPAHYARVQSVLADALFKIDERYFLDLGKGFKFWIDHSTGKREDETNHEILRDRLDSFIKDLESSDSLFTDVDKIKSVLVQIAKIEALRHLPVQNNIIPEGRPDYFG